MADKYQDLAGRIAKDFPPMTGPDIATLRWLDEHPDQAPGRTLTKSDMVEAFGEEYAGWATHRLARVGYTIVPDSKPTNAERWEKFIRDANPALSEPDVEDMAAHMDQFGVRAPVGDDE